MKNILQFFVYSIWLKLRSQESFLLIALQVWQSHIGKRIKATWYVRCNAYKLFRLLLNLWVDRKEWQAETLWLSYCLSKWLRLHCHLPFAISHSSSCLCAYLLFYFYMGSGSLAVVCQRFGFPSFLLQASFLWQFDAILLSHRSVGHFRVVSGSHKFRHVGHFVACWDINSVPMSMLLLWLLNPLLLLLMLLLPLTGLTFPLCERT